VKNRDTIEPFGCLFRVQFSPHYVINHNLTGQSADELVPRRWGCRSANRGNFPMLIRVPATRGGHSTYLHSRLLNQDSSRRMLLYVQLNLKCPPNLQRYL
jgi:hypothetical protein